jgi:hypothetical protein
VDATLDFAAAPARRGWYGLATSSRERPVPSRGISTKPARRRGQPRGVEVVSRRRAHPCFAPRDRHQVAGRMRRSAAPEVPSRGGQGSTLAAERARPMGLREEDSQTCSRARRSDGDGASDEPTATSTRARRACRRRARPVRAQGERDQKGRQHEREAEYGESIAFTSSRVNNTSSEGSGPRRWPRSRGRSLRRARRRPRARRARAVPRPARSGAQRPRRHVPERRQQHAARAERDGHRSPTGSPRDAAEVLSA